MSCPTSPTSPTTGPTRIRIKRPGSESIPRTRSMPPSVSTTHPDAPTPVGATIVAAKRRSITYYTPSSPSPSSQRPSGLDGPRDEPNGKESVSKRSSLVWSSRSPSTRESMSSSDGVAAREREPLTLVERHADLLHFIAQKERKCLELRDQLAAHERELADLKRKWERIVNRGHDPFPNPPLTAGIGGVALDGLKEGVRMITAGFTDLGGAIHELEPSDKDASKPQPHEHPARAKRTGTEHLSTSSMSSIQERVHVSDPVRDGGEGVTMAMAMTVATAPSLARAGSLNSRMHKRASRTIVKAPTTPTTPSVSSPAQSPRSSNLDVGMSLILAPSPTLVPFLPSAAPASTIGSTHGPVGPTSSWMDTMGKKLSGLHKGHTFSNSQKRASSLLAGVSHTISVALSPGPTPTTPAPLPVPTTTTATPRILSTTIPPLTSPASTQSSLTTRPPSPRAHPSDKTVTDWLDVEEEEQTVRAGEVLIPDTKRLPGRTADGGGGPRGAGATVSSFDDDDWNW